MAEPAVQKLVMDVLPVRLEQRAAPQRAAADREQRVHDRQAERDSRDQHGDGGRRLLVGLHRGGGEHEPEEHAPGIAHEDRRRVEVVEQEPDDRARQRRREQHHQRVAALQRDQERRR